MDGELEDIIKCSFIDLICSLTMGYQESENYAFLLVSIQQS